MISIARRRIPLLTGGEYEYVDLGLPSGLLWAKGNIVKNGSTYAIGEETDYGCYFSWGNIDGHNNGDGYDFGTSNSGPYASTPGAQISANIASNDASHDAAFAYLGDTWHMPTLGNFQELYNNTDNEWTAINGINGWKFMKKTDHSVYVFFPAAGFCEGTSVNNVGVRGYYWSSTWYSANDAYRMYFTSSSINPQAHYYRYYGFLVRAVKSQATIIDGYEYVYLGLPSGLKWATCNVGATTETGYGLYFQWGDTDGYVTAGDSTKVFDGADYKYNNDGNSPTESDMSKYNSTDSKTVLDLTDDAAHANMGGKWRMPTFKEFQELVDNTTNTWETNYNGTGVNGRLFISKSDPNAKLFFPAAGFCEGSSLYGVNNGYYLSSSLYTSDVRYSRYLYFYSGFVKVVGYYYRWYGLCVRAVHE